MLKDKLLKYFYWNYSNLISIEHFGTKHIWLISEEDNTIYLEHWEYNMEDDLYFCCDYGTEPEKDHKPKKEIIFLYKLYKIGQ